MKHSFVLIVTCLIAASVHAAEHKDLSISAPDEVRRLADLAKCVTLRE